LKKEKIQRRLGFAHGFEAPQFVEKPDLADPTRVAPTLILLVGTLGEALDPSLQCLQVL